MEFRPRRQWSTSQWKAENALEGGNVGCKTCRERAKICPLMHLQERCGLVTELGGVLKRCQKRSVTFFAAMHFWMELPAETRKSASHHGAIRATRPWHPSHFVSERLGATFDPGNYV